MVETHQFLLESIGLSEEEFIQNYIERFDCPPTKYFLDKFYALKEGKMRKGKKAPSAGEMLDLDRKTRKIQESSKETSAKLKAAIEEIEELEKTLEVVKQIKEVNSYVIKPKKSKGESESVAVVLASDWHLEEEVRLDAVNGLNEFNLTIARKRAEEFFQSTLRLVELMRAGTRIDTLVLALLGDFITNSIHDEMPENNLLGPADALIFAEECLVSGIEFLLDNSDLNLVIPCHSGNHARMTSEQRYATENANSLEYYMYHVIAGHFKNEKRIKFLISPSYFSYLDVFGTVLRFHHGHAIRYGGGVGGLTIPTNKLVARVNKGRRADLDCFGHHHTYNPPGNNFCSNGSLIGYNSYAAGKGFEFEKPKQVLFLVEKKRGVTFNVPVLFSV
jgi:hypothetical protein